MLLLTTSWWHTESEFDHPHSWSLTATPRETISAATRTSAILPGVPLSLSEALPHLLLLLPAPAYGGLYPHTLCISHLPSSSENLSTPHLAVLRCVRAVVAELIVLGPEVGADN